MRRPKGIKTRKSVAKRFKITANGKVLFHGAGRRHLLQGKSPKRRRSLRKASVLAPTDVYRITQNLPFSHWEIVTRNRMDRRRRTKLVFGVLAGGIVRSVLVAVGLVYMGQTHPRF